MEQPSAEQPLQVIACRLPQSLIDAAKRYADLYHSSVSTLLREGLELRLRHTAVPSPSDAPPAVSPATVAMLTQLATTLSAAAEEVRKVCQQHVEGDASNGNTAQTEKASNGNTAQTPAIEPTTDRVAEERESDSRETGAPAQPPSAPLRRGVNKLTPRQVNALRTKRARGVPVKVLMEEYGVSKATVFRYLAQAQPA